MKNEWAINNLKPSPSLNETTISFIGTREQAEQEVDRIANQTGRRTSLHLNSTDTFVYYKKAAR